jgi:hypothetical protein
MARRDPVAPIAESLADLLDELLDDPHAAELQRTLDEAEPPEHLSGVRPWRFGPVQSWAVTCHCGYVRFLASKELAYAVSRRHSHTGDEP